MSQPNPPSMCAPSGPAWLADRRAAAADRFAGLARPTPAEEVWRYSRIDQLDLDRYGPVPAPTSPTAPDDGTSSGIPAAVAPLVEALGARAAVVVTRNGRVTLLEAEPAAAKIVLTSAADDTSDAGRRLDIADTPHDALTALHDAHLADAVVIEVPNGVALSEPIVIVHWVDADAAVIPVRTVVTVGEAAEATVVEIIAGTDVDSLVLPVTALVLGPAANLRYASVQQAGNRVWVVAHQGSTVDRDANLVSASVALGGGYARLRTDSALVGKGASTNLLAVYFGEGDQMHDFRTLQDHRAEKTTSELLFKGAVADTSHSVYTGLIRVENGAHGTKAFQTNRNLVLSEGARADSVPNLEIDENDVACSHASAVGPVDDEQRFYLESRGVPSGVADRLIVLGFLTEVLDRAPVPGLRQPLAAALADRLERVEGPQGFASSHSGRPSAGDDAGPGVAG